MIYTISETTNRITEHDVDNINILSKFFRTLPNREATQQEIDDFLLQEAKVSKLSDLNKNRENYCLELITYNNKTYATTLEASNAISHLSNSLELLTTTAEYPTYPEEEFIFLTKADFQAMASLIQDREIASRKTRKEKKDLINAIVIDQNTTYDQAITALNAIDITF